MVPVSAAFNASLSEPAFIDLNLAADRRTVPSDSSPEYRRITVDSIGVKTGSLRNFAGIPTNGK
jgi:hypothetical protein